MPVGEKKTNAFKDRGMRGSSHVLNRLIRIDSRPWQAMYIGERAPLVDYHEPLSTLRHTRAALSFPTRGLGPHSSDWLAIESLPSSLSDRPCRNLGHLSPAAPAALYGFQATMSQCASLRDLEDPAAPCGSASGTPYRGPQVRKAPCAAVRVRCNATTTTTLPLHACSATTP